MTPQSDAPHDEGAGREQTPTTTSKTSIPGAPRAYQPRSRRARGELKLQLKKRYLLEQKKLRRWQKQLPVAGFGKPRRAENDKD